MTNNKVSVLGETVLIKLEIELPKEEKVTKGGIVIPMNDEVQKAQALNKIPSYGLVIQVGPEVPEATKKLILNKNVAMPSGKFYQVPDIDNPDMDLDDYKGIPERYVWANYKDLHLVFNNVKNA